MAVISWNTINVLLHCLMFITASSTLIAMNKKLMTNGNYPHALPLVMMHMLTCTCLGVIGYTLFPHKYEKMDMVKANKMGYLKMLIPLGFFCATSFVLSNIAYNYCSVALLQIMKEANVIMVFIGSCLIGLKQLTIRNVVNLSLIVMFAALAVSGDVHYAVTGVVVQIISQVMECAKIVVMNKVLTQANDNPDSPVKGLDPLSTVTLVSPIVFFMLLTVGCFTFDRAWIEDIPAVWPLLLANCCMAFVLNCILALVIKVCSGVGLTLCGVFKDVILVCLSSYIFAQPLSLFQWGCFSCVVSGILVHAVLENYKEDFEKGFGRGVTAFAYGVTAILSGDAQRDAAKKDVKDAVAEESTKAVADEEAPLINKDTKVQVVA